MKTYVVYRQFEGLKQIHFSFDSFRENFVVDTLVPLSKSKLHSPAFPDTPHGRVEGFDNFLGDIKVLSCGFHFSVCYTY